MGPKTDPYAEGGAHQVFSYRTTRSSSSRPGTSSGPDTETNYFERNAARTRYPKFRKIGLFVGSGVMRPNARRLSARVSNNPECFGPYGRQRHHRSSLQPSQL